MWPLREGCYVLKGGEGGGVQSMPSSPQVSVAERRTVYVM